MIPSVHSPKGLMQPSTKKVVTIGSRTLTHSPSAKSLGLPLASFGVLPASSARTGPGTRPTVSSESAAAATNVERIDSPPVRGDTTPLRLGATLFFNGAVTRGPSRVLPLDEAASAAGFLASDQASALTAAIADLSCGALVD